MDFEFTNVLNKERDGAQCSVLRVGDIKILMDCGCDEAASAETFERVAKVASEVDFIFLSHAHYMSLGCLPYLHTFGTFN